MSVVLAIDPGSTLSASSHTGIVLLSGVTLLDSWQVGGGVTGFREWYHRFGTYTGSGYVPFDVVVCEQFVDRQVMGADRSPLLIEGAVRFLWPDVVLQPASGYKQAIPDDILKHFDLWSFTGKDHHDDRRAAARHALRYLKNAKDPDVLAAFR